MSNRQVSGSGLYDRIVTRVDAYSPVQIASFTTARHDVDPEDRFTALVKDSLTSRDTVIDLGTGTGDWFLLEVAPGVAQAIGIDESGLSLTKARQRACALRARNVGLLQADVAHMPLADATANVVLSRRGPLTSGAPFLQEAQRVLAPGGLAIEITIGEQNALEVTQVFGTSQMAPEARFGPRLPRLEALLRTAGLEPILGEDYRQSEYFPSEEALQYRLLTTPIFANYDPDTHASQFDELVRLCKTDDGIGLAYHRLVIAARKPR